MRRTALKVNPEKVREWIARSRRPLPRRSDRRDRYEAELDVITPSILRRADYRCEARIPMCCDNRGKLVRHHRKPRSQGGDNSPANLMMLCERCHQWVHQHPRWAREHGYLVRRNDDPNRIGWDQLKVLT